MTAWLLRLWVLAGSLLLLVFIYGVTAVSILDQWAKDPLGHGYLVIPGALYLAWTRRDRLLRAKSRPAFWWLPLLAVGSLLWLIANITSTAGLQQFCFAFLVLGFVWGTLGTAAARELAFPLGLLLFAVPIGDYLVPTLQKVTAMFAVKLLQLSGVPVLMNRELISIPGSTWEVAAACAGINYLMSALVMAYLYAGLAYRSTLRRIAFFLSAIPVALLANGLRVYITISVAAAGAPEVAAGMRHYLVGWFVFAIILGTMFVVGTRFEESHAKSVSPGNPIAVAGPVFSRWSAPVFVALGLGIVAVAPLSASRIRAAGRTLDSPALAPSVSVSSPWQESSRDLDGWAPHVLQADAVFEQTYTDGRSLVAVYHAFYNAANPETEVGSKGEIVIGRNWIAAPPVRRSLGIGGRLVQVNETQLHSELSTIVLWNWYSVDQVATSRDYVAKLLLAKSRLLGRRHSAATIAIATDAKPGTDAMPILLGFLEHLMITPRGTKP